MRPFLPLAALVTAALAQQPGPVLAQEGTGTKLDYDFFSSQVQPIFLAERPGHPRLRQLP